jgi:hypothetical protein
MALLTSGRFQEAESELQRARLQAAEQSDSYTLDKVLAELAHLYCLMQPPDFEKAEMYSLERERVNASGQSKLQTATMYYWSMHDPERTVHKVQQAAAQARSEDGGGGFVSPPAQAIPSPSSYSPPKGAKITSRATRDRSG